MNGKTSLVPWHLLCTPSVGLRQRVLLLLEFGTLGPVLGGWWSPSASTTYGSLHGLVPYYVDEEQCQLSDHECHICIVWYVLCIFSCHPNQTFMLPSLFSKFNYFRATFFFFLILFLITDLLHLLGAECSHCFSSFYLCLVFHTTMSCCMMSQKQTGN